MPTKLTIRLSPDARAAADRVAAAAGTTLTALIEAAVLFVDENPDRVPDEIIEAAREIDAARRNRR